MLRQRIRQALGRLAPISAALTAASASLVLALAAAGCGFGPGDDRGEADLRVTRDFGASTLLTAQDRVTESDTVMRLLERNADISTRYGGGFVQAIDGVEAAEEGGRRFDWFFYVNGVESTVGAADYSLGAHDVVWWDFRDWSAAMRVPAVVGAWPQPFLGGYDGRSHPVIVECAGGGPACGAVRVALERAGAAPAPSSAPSAIRVLVGPWRQLRTDPAAAQIEAGPAVSGVFAEFRRGRNGLALWGLDEAGNTARSFGPGTGLVAATRRYEGPPVWVVTGAGAAGVMHASELLDAADLRDHYAVVSNGARTTPLPLPAGR